MGHHEHQEHARKQVTCWVITLSDTRAEGTDVSGKLMVERLEQNGHIVAKKIILPDEPEQFEAVLREGIASDDVQAILCNGGTGISARDCSYEAVERVLEKRLDGFGELFRVLSYEEIGSAAMMSRAVAGIANGTAIFSVPGSKHAVELALTRLILPELGHILWELTKHA